MQQLNWTEIERRAKLMTVESLTFAADDAVQAAFAAEDLEKAGCRVSKSGGYYRDEASVYRTELRRRSGKDGVS